MLCEVTCPVSYVIFWDVYPNTVLPAKNNLVVENVGDSDKCRLLCVQADDFDCLSIEYSAVDGICSLSNTVKDNNNQRLKSDWDYDYHHWRCLHGKTTCNYCIIIFFFGWGMLVFELLPLQHVALFRFEVAENVQNMLKLARSLT